MRARRAVDPREKERSQRAAAIRSSWREAAAHAAAGIREHEPCAEVYVTHWEGDRLRVLIGGTERFLAFGDEQLADAPETSLLARTKRESDMRDCLLELVRGSAAEVKAYGR